MPSFDAAEFAHRLIAEALFYDEEYGALGNLSLVDAGGGRELFLASYSPDDGVFVVERATSWEEERPSDNDAIGYLLAVDSDEHATFSNPDEAARALLVLAQEHGLYPSVTLLFEDDEVA